MDGKMQGLLPGAQAVIIRATEYNNDLFETRP
jgi:hypothetical protein